MKSVAQLIRLNTRSEVLVWRSQNEPCVFLLIYLAKFQLMCYLISEIVVHSEPLKLKFVNLLSEIFTTDYLYLQHTTFMTFGIPQKELIHG